MRNLLFMFITYNCIIFICFILMTRNITVHYKNIDSLKQKVFECMRESKETENVAKYTKSTLKRKQNSTIIEENILNAIQNQLVRNDRLNGHYLIEDDQGNQKNTYICVNSDDEFLFVGWTY